MVRIGRIAALVAALALAAGSTVGVAAQEEPEEPEGPTLGTLATGQVFHVDAIDFRSVSGSGDTRFERDRTVRRRSEMSDPRLSGTVTVHDDADRWPEGDLVWGTIEIANDGGTWTGTSVGTTDMTADGGGVTYHELVGSGGYDGLSAVIFEREVWDTETRTGENFWNGVIFPGDLPPDR
jgi:hypothetical protein